jgi:hypothetical protein
MAAFIFYTTEAQAVRPRRAIATGILTDRLSAKRLERWRKIERIITWWQPMNIEHRAS